MSYGHAARLSYGEGCCTACCDAYAQARCDLALGFLRLREQIGTCSQAGILGRFLPWGGAATSGSAPSSEPAVSLHMASKPGSQQLSLLVLTEGSLDRWQVCFDLAPASRLLSNAFCMCRQVKLQLSDRG